ncbi:MAG: hypothetical protein RL179_2122 [Planctomycetota bacterium]
MLRGRIRFSPSTRSGTGAVFRSVSLSNWALYFRKNLTLLEAQGPGIYSVSEPVKLSLAFPQKLCPSTG